ncbi:hypothetical protein [Kitasatospora sp. NPDC002965]|uniref:hypothetical protein n=1 Tax=Kitasatospora sp. NPDC002965 TaxID=3154775 RepID=UPI0033A608B0
MRIRVPDPRERGRWRRRLPSLTLVLAVVGALVTVPIGLGTAPQALAASAKTVTGPKVWIPGAEPGTGTYGPHGSVTVSQTESLTDQVIQVSWSGFTPSVLRTGEQATAVQQNSDQVMYPVRIYQCRGTDPKVMDCYGSTMFGADPAAGFEQKYPPQGTTAPDLPSNMAIAVTGADGSGTAPIEVRSSRLSPSLGCDAAHPCSIVVEANYGGDPLDLYGMRNGQPDCADHMIDNDGAIFYTATDVIMTGYENPFTGMNGNEQCAWANRVVIPLTFNATPEDCGVRANDFVVSGLEMLNRAMQQWITGLCLGKTPLTVQYSSGGGEPQARQSFLRGTRDVGLTALPDRDPPTRPYVYAPLATTGISVAFLVDSPTGRQIRDMKLNARLVAKLLTQSYRAPGIEMPTVGNNPNCIFADEEFRSLNPLPPTSGLAWPECGGGPEKSLPIVLGTSTDLTYQLTSWIASDPEAARFLEGEQDPWGTRVNTRYMRPEFGGYPTDQLVREDDSGGVETPGGTPLPDHVKHWKQFEWNPLQTSLNQVLRFIQQGQVTAKQANPDAQGNHPSFYPQVIGERMLFAILDSAQAKAYAIPEASLKNAAGAFVSPSRDTLQSAVADMPVDPATGTQLLPYGATDSAYARDQRAYPLTTVQYAMVPTGGVPAEKAAAIGTFLKTVTDTGQLYGVEPGRLPEGFLALTKEQRAQAQDAVQHVTAQDGKWPGNQKPPTTPGGGENPSGTGGTDGGAGTTGGTSTGGASTGGSSGTGGAGTTGGTGTTGSTGTTGTPVTDGSASSSGSSGTSGTSGTSGGSGTSGSSGTSGGVGGSATGGSGATAGGAPAPAATAPAAAKPAPSAAPSQNGGPLAAAPVAAGSPSADRSGSARLLLPIALIAGLVLLVGGPAALVLGGTPAGARLTAATRGVWARIRRSP